MLRKLSNFIGSAITVGIALGICLVLLPVLVVYTIIDFLVRGGDGEL